MAIIRILFMKPELRRTAATLWLQILLFINHSMSKRAAGNMIVSSRFAEEHGKEEGGLGTFLIDDRLNAEEALALLDHAAGNDEIFVSGCHGTAAQALMGL